MRTVSGPKLPTISRSRCPLREPRAPSGRRSRRPRSRAACVSGGLSRPPLRPRSRLHPSRIVPMNARTRLRTPCSRGLLRSATRSGAAWSVLVASLRRDLPRRCQPPFTGGSKPGDHAARQFSTNLATGPDKPRGLARALTNNVCRSPDATGRNPFLQVRSGALGPAGLPAGCQRPLLRRFWSNETACR